MYGRNLVRNSELFKTVGLDVIRATWTRLVVTCLHGSFTLAQPTCVCMFFYTRHTQTPIHRLLCEFGLAWLRITVTLEIIFNWFLDLESLHLLCPYAT